jgi:ABC-2 type transport system permease protein
MTTTTLLSHQVRLEQRAFWRNREAAFFTFAMPIGLLLIFGAIERNATIPGHGGGSALRHVIPGFLAFGLVVCAYGNLASTLVLARSEGILKRIRATPLEPSLYLTCVAITISCITLGWGVFGVLPSSAGLGVLLATLVLGVVCFASLGVALTGFIPSADAAGPVTNGTYVPLAIISGTFSDDLRLPGWLNHVVSALPIKPFTESLRVAYSATPGPLPVGRLAVLAVWAVIGVVLARRSFRWDP